MSTHSDPIEIPFRSRTERRLYEELTAAHSSLGDMYAGAKRVLEDSSNPDSLAQAANSLRELMEKSPEYIDVPESRRKLKRGYNLRQKVCDLEREWRSMLERTGTCVTGDGWRGDIDAPLSNFLRRFRTFIDEFVDLLPTRSQEVRELRRRRDPLKNPLGTSIEESFVKRWKDLFSYFQSVVHHRRSPIAAEFQDYVAALESIFIAILLPQTLSDWGTIDRDIARLEQL